MEPNLAGLLTRAASLEPHRTALSEAASGRRVSYAELEEQVDAVAAGLYDAGLVAGVRVALLSRNNIELVTAYLGVLRAGMVAVPVDPGVPTGELLRVLVDSGARLVAADETAVTTVRAAVQGLDEALGAAGRSETPPPRVVTLDGPAAAREIGWEQLVDPAGQPAPVRPDPDALAALLYTSGASGRPRAAMLTHRALLANVEQVAGSEQTMLHGNDVVLGALPLHHAYGLCAVLGQVLRQQARLVLVDRFVPEECLDLVQDEAVTVAPVAPSVLTAWLGLSGLRERLGPLRHVVSGSALLAPELAARFTEVSGVVVHQGYGLTECGPVVTSTLAGPASTEGTAVVTRSVGRALPGVGLRLVDDLGRAPVEGDPGRILVRGPQLFSGYWPGGRGGPAGPPDGDDGWWDTGDVGLLDADGDLHLVDRVADVVVVSGFQVFPVEVEAVLAEHPQVAEVAVVGVEDDETGEAVVAFVRPREGIDAFDADGLAEQLRAHYEAVLARFKVPAVLHVVDELPRTATGKVQKGRLRARARGRDRELFA